MRRPAMQMAAAMVPTAEMGVAMAAATMHTAVMAAAVTTPATTPMASAAFRDGKVGHRQRGREDEDSNSQSEL